MVADSKIFFSNFILNEIHIKYMQILPDMTFSITLIPKPHGTGEKGIQVCIHGWPWYEVLHVVSSCSTNWSWDQERRSWNSNQSMHHTIIHGTLCLLSSLFECVPVQVVQHGGNTACSVLVSHYKAGRTSLDHLKLVDICACLGSPDTGSILQDLNSSALKAGNWWIIDLQ